MVCEALRVRAQRQRTVGLPDTAAAPGNLAAHELVVAARRFDGRARSGAEAFKFAAFQSLGPLRCTLTLPCQPTRKASMRAP